MSNYKLPLPLMTKTSKVFWDGCKEGKLLYQVCADCGQYMNLPKIICSNCMSRNLEWKESKGKGKIYMFTTTYAFSPPEFMGALPYTVALIKLDEGPKFMSNIIECDPKELKCDMPVEVVFDKVTEQVTLHKFRPAKV